MRILLACAAFPPHGKGGGPASSWLIASGLAELGHVVRVVTVAEPAGARRESGFEVQILPSLNVHWNYWTRNPVWRKALWHLLENFNPRALVAMRQEIRNFRPDVLMTISIENINVACWLAARLEHVPCAHMIYSYFLRCWRGSMFRGGANCKTSCGACYLSSLGKKLLSRFVGGVVAETRFPLKAHIDAGYFPNAVSRVIPAALVMPKDVFPRSVRTGPFRIGYIGLHAPAKGIETLADAAHDLTVDQELPVEFVIAGDGAPGYTQSLVRRFPPAARFVGWRRPEEFFPLVDIIVVPSIWNEPFGRVCVEAMSYGVSVVAARSGGIPESVIDGECGALFEPGNAVELAAVLRRLVQDRVDLVRMSAAALRHAQSFTSQNVATNLIAFLAEVQRQKYSPIRTLSEVRRGN